MSEQTTRTTNGDPDPGELDGLEDSRCVREFLAGSGREAACRRLVGKYWRAVVGSIRLRVRSLRDAEEVAQDAFTKAFRSLEGLDDPRCFAAWLFRIAGNTTTDFLRRRGQMLSLDELLATNGVDEASTIEGDPVERAEDVNAVLEAVAELPEKYRTAVTLRYCMGLSAKDVADRLGEPEGTVRNRVFRALAKLRAALASTDTPAPTGKGTRS